MPSQFSSIEFMQCGQIIGISSLQQNHLKISELELIVVGICVCLWLLNSALNDTSGGEGTSPPPQPPKVFEIFVFEEWMLFERFGDEGGEVVR